MDGVEQRAAEAGVDGVDAVAEAVEMSDVHRVRQEKWQATQALVR
jgi:hypothetical protein